MPFSGYVSPEPPHTFYLLLQGSKIK